jgi:outer membrane protein OmpA-like peptidoglycan-associated protein
VSLTTLALTLALLGSGNTGTSVLPVLRIGQGPRAAALGEAFTGLADDAGAVYWNPAGLGHIDQYHIALSHHQWFAGITDEVLHATLPFGPGAFGAGIIYSGDPGIEHWSEENQPGDTFSTWNAGLAVAYGLPLSEQYAVGLTIKGLHEDLYDATGTGGAIDVGVLGEPVPDLKVGVSARHLGFISYNSPEELPAEVAAGASFQRYGITVLLDVVVPFDSDINVRVGLEYAPVPEIALRVGYRTGPTSLAGLGALAGLTGGIGLTHGNYGVDYSITPYGELGIVHRVGLRASFRPPVPPVTGDLDLRVLDADTRTQLSANLILSGVLDTTATTGELDRAGINPGRVIVRSIRSQYAPGTDTFEVLAGRKTEAVILLERLKYGDVKGGIYDAGTKEPIGGRIVYRGPALGDQPVPPTPGTYRIRHLPIGEYRVGITGPSEEYVPQACTIRTKADSVHIYDFYLVRKQQTIVLEGVNFETGKAEILPRFTAVLDTAGTILKRTPGIHVELAGHTDPREIRTAEFPSNWELSAGRAEAVRRHLIDKFGIAPERLTAKGYADTQPVADNATPGGMARNRRTEFRVVDR